MNKDSLVSVVVATYRRKHELVRALNSLSNQSYKNLEILLVDDCGNDEWNKTVEEIFQEYIFLNPDIKIKKIVNAKTLGSAVSRNVGIEASIGEYVTFLDDDDVYMPDKIKNQLNFMVENNLDYTITNLDLYYENGKLSERRKRHYIKSFDSKSLIRYHMMYHMTGTDVLMFKRSYLIKIGCFPKIDVGDEFYLMESAILSGGSFGYLDCCDVMAYVHASGIGLSSGKGKIDGENFLYNYKKKYFKDFDYKSVKYIKMRHYAVLAFANFKEKKYIRCLLNSFVSFISSPIMFCKLVFGNSR